jgi:hypothetical protein
LPLKASLARF